jgi:phthalate 4,5-dioxygenase
MAISQASTQSDRRRELKPITRRLTAEENVRLTRVGKGTPMGELFRTYWIPACLSEEMPGADDPPVRVRLLGEDLVAFRDSSGKVGLVDAYCAHRRAPLFFGRNEACGLRCVYHGWKYDTSGVCVDLPSEPSSSRMKTHVKIKAYPVFEAGGVVWTYMGRPEQLPEVPDYEWLRVPSTHSAVSKTLQGCNFMQAIEGGIDTAHVGFLHNEDIRNPRLLATTDNAPTVEVEVTGYGFRYVGIRHVRPGELYVRGYQFVLPCLKLQGQFLNLFGDVPAKGDLNSLMRSEAPHVYGHLWVPLDDENTATYNLNYATDREHPFPDGYIEAAESGAGRGRDDLIPGTYWLKKNLANNYMVDRERQKNTTYTGIIGVNTQDIAIQEGMGPIVDRSEEFIGTTDRAICTARDLLLEAAQDVEDGRPPRALDPKITGRIRAVDAVIPENSDWRSTLADGFVARW